MYVQCAVRIRAVERRGTEERSFGICRGKVDVHNRAGAYGWSTGIYEYVQIYIGDSVEDLLRSFLLPARGWGCRNVCTECERDGVRACMMDAHMRYTEQLRMKSEAVCDAKTRKER